MNYVVASPLYSPARSVASLPSSGKASYLVLDDTVPNPNFLGTGSKYAWGSLALCVATCSLTSILLGYDVGIMSGALPLMKEALGMDNFQVGIIAGSLNFIAGLGALPFGQLADVLGRKIAMIVACIAFAIGTGLMAASTDFSMLLVARGIMGSGVGATFVIAPVYLAELVPAEVRGALVCCFDICINVGILLGFVGGYVIDTYLEASGNVKWRLMIGVGTIPPIAIALASIFLPESPRWLVQMGRRAEAEAALSRVVVDQRLVQEEIDVMTTMMHSEMAASFKQLLSPSTKSMRRALHVTLGLSILQQATGSEAAILFTPLILSNAGVKSTRAQLMWALPVGVAKLLGELISVPILDKAGRRPLLLVGNLLQSISLGALAVGFAYKWNWHILIALISAFMLSFEIGAPIAWLMPSELYNSGYRGRAQSVSVIINRCTSGMVVLTFPMLLDYCGSPGLFCYFALIAFGSTIWTYFAVPETAGLSLEEITTLLREESFGHLSEASHILPSSRPRGRSSSFSSSSGTPVHTTSKRMMMMNNVRKNKNKNNKNNNKKATTTTAASSSSKKKNKGRVAFTHQSSFRIAAVTTASSSTTTTTTTTTTTATHEEKGNTTRPHLNDDGDSKGYAAHTEGVNAHGNEVENDDDRKL